MESTENEGGNALLKTQLTRRTAVTAAAWSAPVVAMAAATPAVAASGTFEVARLTVAPLGGAEGRYSTGGNFKDGVVNANTDFRRAFSVTNNGTGTFTGTLTIKFQFPRIWNQGLGEKYNTNAFQNYSTVDLRGLNGGKIGGKTDWIGGKIEWTLTGNTVWEQNYGKKVENGDGDAWGAVHQRMDEATFNLKGVELPPGGVIWFALNASIPESWIGSAGPPPVYLTGGRIYWRSDVDITAITDGGDTLGPYRTPVGGWTNGIWYFNGGGPYAWEAPGTGIYPAYGTD